MKAVVKTREAPGAELVEMDVPRPGADEVLVELMAGSICGTDVHIYAWDAGARVYIKNVPQVLGHEFAGKIVEVGKERAGVQGGRPCLRRNPYLLRRVRSMPQRSTTYLRDGQDIRPDLQRLFCRVLHHSRTGALEERPPAAAGIASIQEPLGNAVYCALGDYDRTWTARAYSSSATAPSPLWPRVWPGPRGPAWCHPLPAREEDADRQGYGRRSCPQGRPGH
jgi:threonine 3-dehydrogenase